MKKTFYTSTAVADMVSIFLVIWVSSFIISVVLDSATVKCVNIIEIGWYFWS